MLEFKYKNYQPYLGATSIDKISEVWLSDEIGEGGGLKFWKKQTS